MAWTKNTGPSSDSGDKRNDSPPTRPGKDNTSDPRKKPDLPDVDK